MMMYLLYWALLAVWVLLLWPAFRLHGRQRAWLLLVVFVAIAALLHEIRVYVRASEAIRLDIILISLVLGLLYGSAAVLLFARRWLRTAALLAAVLAVIGAGAFSLNTISGSMRGCTKDVSPSVARLAVAWWTVCDQTCAHIGR